MAIEKLDRLYQQVLERRLPRWVRTLFEAVLLLVREISKNQLHIRSATLSYWSLVAMVPVLVLAAVVLRALGMAATPIRELLFRTVLAGAVQEVGSTLDGWVENLDFAGLGIAGLLGVLWTGSRIFFQAEEAYNHLWGVPLRKGLVGRLLLFYAGVTLGPLVLAYGFHLTESLSVDPNVLSTLAPIVLSTTAFVAAIRLLPNTKVRWTPALAGGLISGVLFELAKLAFSAYTGILGTQDSNAAIYGSLALAPIFLLWLYILWLIVLVGVEIAFVVQHWEELRASAARRLRSDHVVYPDAWFALDILLSLVRQFRESGGPVPITALATKMGKEELMLMPVLQVLEEGGILASTERGYLPAKPVENLLLREVVENYRALTLPLGGSTGLLGELLNEKRMGRSVAEELSPSPQ